MLKILLKYFLLLSLSSISFAKDWDYNDYNDIVNAGNQLLKNDSQYRKQSQIVDKEVTRLMLDLGLSGGKFVAFAADDLNDPIVQKKKAIYQIKRKAKRTQTNAHLQFANASYRLDRVALKKVEALARTYQISKNQIRQITIKGHTNSIGSDRSNLLLSHNRAASVRTALLQRGVPSNLIRVQGFGETSPLTGTQPNQPVNRRVEYEVLKR